MNLALEAKLMQRVNIQLDDCWMFTHGSSYMEQREIARLYEVHESTIYKIKYRKTWRHI